MNAPHPFDLGLSMKLGAALHQERRMHRITLIACVVACVALGGVTSWAARLRNRVDDLRAVIDAEDYIQPPSRASGYCLSQQAGIYYIHKRAP